MSVLPPRFFVLRRAGGHRHAAAFPLEKDEVNHTLCTSKNLMCGSLFDNVCFVRCPRLGCRSSFATSSRGSGEEAEILDEYENTGNFLGCAFALFLSEMSN